jgi:raffinose/stachyose/melibiose transport system substrate-binding protein
MSGNIFINYRRDDSSASAGRLYDRLSAHFPKNQIFMDVDNLDPGVDFVEAIEQSVGACDVLIAVIGKRWLISTDEKRKRRLNNPKDFVRLEIATALKRNVRVIPVLVDNASMPRASDLPDDLKPLVHRNAVEVSHTRFSADSARLIAALERVLEKTAAEQREREEKARFEAERYEVQKNATLEAERRQNEEKLEHAPQSQLSSPVAPSAAPAQTESDQPSAKTSKMVHPLPPKPAESEHEMSSQPSSGGTPKENPSKQAIAFLAIVAVLVVAGLIYLVTRPPFRPVPFVAATSSPAIPSATESPVQATSSPAYKPPFVSPVAPLVIETPTPARHRGEGEAVIKILHIQSSPEIRAIWQKAAEQYESGHPGVKVQFDYLENEAFKAKLPSLLQSQDRPSAFHSWGGGVMYEQVNAGVCQDITKAASEGGFKDTFYPAAVQNFAVAGKLYGLPNDVGPIILWYNKDLCQKAGVDPRKIQYWDDFVEAVKKCQVAGIIPAAVGGKDKWPLHLYTAILMMRILGKDGMEALYQDKNGGFVNPDIIKAFTLFQNFAAFQPFQKGYLANTYSEAGGIFHDGKAAFHLMGSWDLVYGRANAANKKGLPDEKLGWIFFPEVKGGKGKANDLFASLDGWLVTKGAPQETIDFMKVWLGNDVQTELAEQGLFIPAVKGTADAIRDPLLKQLAAKIDSSQWIQVALDQLLGPDTGRIFNDMSADLASENTTPEKAAKAIEASWRENNM